MGFARSTTLLTALLVLLAGCSAGVPGAGDAATGTVAFYLSDQPAAIDDFSSLNVTVTRVAFHPQGDDADEDATADGSPTAPSATPPTVTGSPTATMTATAEGSEAVDADDDGWIVRSVDNRTVDLTELVGDRATLVGEYDLPAGPYNGVFITVSAANGTLTDGTEVDVKVPGRTLRLNTHFTLEPEGEVDFVFDITVVETGNGRYLIQPVISESGTDVPIDDVGAAAGGSGGSAGDGSGAGDGGPSDRGNRSDAGGQGSG